MSEKPVIFGILLQSSNILNSKHEEVPYLIVYAGKQKNNWLKTEKPAIEKRIGEIYPEGAWQINPHMPRLESQRVEPGFSETFNQALLEGYKPTAEVIKWIMTLPPAILGSLNLELG